MSIPIGFPGLGLEFSLSNVAFTIGGFNVYWYGLLIGVGMLLALLMAFSQSTRFGIDPDRMIDVIIIGFVLGIVGARLYYVAFSGQSYGSFYDLVNLRGGGLAIYGGVIGAFVGALLGCKWRKVPVAPMLDLTAMGFLIGQSIGRWGNFFNQEAFGTNTTLPWGMISPATTAYLSQPDVKELLTRAGATVAPDLPVHPTFLYESLWCALGFALLFFYRKRRRFNGEIALMYVMWYGLGRAGIEGLRTDPLMLGTLRVSQVLAILSVLAAFVIWVVARGRTRGIALRVPEIPPHTAKVRLDTDAGKQEVIVQWPHDRKAPGRAEQLELAKAALEALGDEKPDGPIVAAVGEPAANKADDAQAEEPEADTADTEEPKTDAADTEAPKAEEPPDGQDAPATEPAEAMPAEDAGEQAEADAPPAEDANGQAGTEALSAETGDGPEPAGPDNKA